MSPHEKANSNKSNNDEKTITRPTKLKNIIFDIGNVIVAWEPFLALNAIYDDIDSMKQGLKEANFEEWNREQDRGRTWQDGIALAPAGSDASKVYEAYYEGLREAHSQRVEGTTELIQQLLEAKNKDDGSTIQIGGCTNASLETFVYMKQSAPILEKFTKGIVVSAEEHVVKPDKTIFEICLKRFNFNPEETMFVDDSSQNCVGARSVGMHAHQFTTSQGLEMELQKYELL